MRTAICGALEKLRLELVADGIEISNVNSACVVGTHGPLRDRGAVLLLDPNAGPNTRVATSHDLSAAFARALATKSHPMCAKCGNVFHNTWFEGRKKGIDLSRH